MDQVPAAPAAPAAQPGKEVRTALVFVPGISRSWGERSLQDIADDMVVSLSKLTRSHAFTATAADSFQYGFGTSPRTARVVKLARRAPEGSVDPVPIVDLYELDYVRKLTADQESKPIVVRALFVAWAFVRGLRQFVETIGRPGKTGRQLGQLLLFLFVLALYAILLLTLLITIVELVLEAFSTARATLQGTAVSAPVVASSPAPTPVPAPAVPAADGSFGAAWARLGHTFAPVIAVFGWLYDTIFRGLSVVAVLIWLLLPPKHKLKEAVTNSATDYLAVDYYLRAGAGSQQLAGEVGSLLDAIRRRDLAYTRIDLAGYSLGSIVVFNAVFPFGNPPNPAGPIADVHTVVTIGCPFDLVRVLRPEYFKKRRQLPNVPKAWLNVYTPNDILGSNFRDDEKLEDGDLGVIAKAISIGSPEDEQPVEQVEPVESVEPLKPENVVYYPGGVPLGTGLLDILVFSGLRAHAQYWDVGLTGEETCFDEIVTRLYADHFLAEPDPASGPT